MMSTEFNDTMDASSSVTVMKTSNSDGSVSLSSSVFPFKLEEPIGRGTFGIVFRCVDQRDGRYYACKTIQKQRTAMSMGGLSSTSTSNNVCDEDLKHEIMLWLDLSHCNIVRLLSVFVNDMATYLIMEYMNGGQLFDQIVQRKQYSEMNAISIMAQLSAGLAYLHMRNVVHRDLKPENLLCGGVSHELIKISDFGMSCEAVGERGLITVCGTPGYVAPEVFLRSGYGVQSDVWSLGVVLYIILYGFPPFHHADDMELLRISAQGHFLFPADTVSEKARDIIQRMLVLDPATRIQSHALRDHPWLRCESGGSREHMAETIKQLKKFNARRTFKAAALVVQFANRTARGFVGPPPDLRPVTPNKRIRKRRHRSFNDENFCPPEPVRCDSLTKFASDTDSIDSDAFVATTVASGSRGISAGACLPDDMLEIRVDYADDATLGQLLLAMAQGKASRGRLTAHTFPPATLIARQSLLERFSIDLNVIAPPLEDDVVVVVSNDDDEVKGDDIEMKDSDNVVEN